MQTPKHEPSTVSLNQVELSLDSLLHLPALWCLSSGTAASNPWVFVKGDAFQRGESYQALCSLRPPYHQKKVFVDQVKVRLFLQWLSEILQFQLHCFLIPSAFRNLVRHSWRIHDEIFGISILLCIANCPGTPYTDIVELPSARIWTPCRIIYVGDAVRFATEASPRKCRFILLIGHFFISLESLH